MDKGPHFNYKPHLLVPSESPVWIFQGLEAGEDTWSPFFPASFTLTETQKRRLSFGNQKGRQGVRKFSFSEKFLIRLDFETVLGNPGLISNVKYSPSQPWISNPPGLTGLNQYIFTITFDLCVCVHICVYVCACLPMWHSAHMEVRRQHVGHGFCLPIVFHGLNWSPQAWWQAPFSHPTGSFLKLMIYFVCVYVSMCGLCVWDLRVQVCVHMKARGGYLVSCDCLYFTHLGQGFLLNEFKVRLVTSRHPPVSALYPSTGSIVAWVTIPIFSCGSWGCEFGPLSMYRKCS